jgi:hypothetical protein
VAEELPGFLPYVLRLDDVSLLRADETLFNAMVDGWRAQMLARGLAHQMWRIVKEVGSSSRSLSPHQ